jgi:hypothetical protein
MNKEARGGINQILAVELDDVGVIRTSSGAERCGLVKAIMGMTRE